MVDRSLALAHLSCPARPERRDAAQASIQHPGGRQSGRTFRGSTARSSAGADVAADARCPTTDDQSAQRGLALARRPIFDVRPDVDRPKAIQLLKFNDPLAVEAALTEAGGPRAIEGYQAVAARQQYSLETLKNSRQILFRSNFGLVRFERREGVLHAIHEMYTAARVPNESGTEPPTPELFVLHEAALSTPGAIRPEDTLVVDPDEVEPA